MIMSSVKTALKFSVLCGLVSLSACGDKTNNDEKLFEKIGSDQSGITFINTVPENDTLNQFTYHYLYNGSGVAIGDINNDGLPDMYFSGNEKSSKLYLNKGDFKFEDITESSKTATNQWISGVYMVDVNNDGFLDIYACSSGPMGKNVKKSNLLFINQKNSTFKESAAEWGVNDDGNATCATFFDMDNDGDLDMYLGNHADQFFANINTPYSKGLNLDHQNQQHLYRNDGTKFTDISEEAGIKAMGYCLSATAGDFNEDGLTDLYVCNDYHFPDFYLVNKGNGKFVDEFTTYFKHSSTNSMGSDQGDINNDGWLDLISLDMLADNPRRYMQLMGPKDYDYTMVGIRNGYRNQYMKNALQINLGNGHFGDMAYLYGVAKSDWSWSPLLSDFNDDGFLDIFVSNGYYRDVTDLDFMLYQMNLEKSKRNTFTQEELLKLIPYEKLQNFLFMNQSGNGFVNMAESMGLEDLSHSAGAGVADFNGDGKMDIIVCNQAEEPFLYKNVSTQGHYLNIKAEGNKNKFGIGVKVFVEDSVGGNLRKFELHGTKGYQSSSQPMIHLGTGDKKKLPSITIVWPGGKYQKIENVSCDETITVKESDASGSYHFEKSLQEIFTENDKQIGLDFLHQEQENPDFKREPLLPHRYTTLGPGVSSADVNNDGKMDVFITNARTSSGCKLYLQQAGGKLSASASQPWKSLSNVDIVGSLFFDADGDGDEDLYLAPGGSEYDIPSPNYDHKIYINDGKGNFALGKGILPAVNTSGGPLTASDYDGDGDLDLFVGGRVLPGHYPQLAVRSYLLRNEGGKFRDVTEALAPDLYNAGMITSAVWADFSGDNKPDLVLTGEWMPLIFLENVDSKLVNKTADYGDPTISGWMNSVIPVDIENDGDLDFVVGNKGNNSFIQAAIDRPTKIYWADFDKNGGVDIAMGYTYNGTEYPLFTMDEMGRAYPLYINKKFTRYREIAGKTMLDIFGKENLEQNSLRANYFSSFIAINNGGKFEFRELPFYTQAGPVFGLVAVDIDGNGFDDIVGIGNNYNTRVPHGRDDAQSGFILMNQQGNLNFTFGNRMNFYNQLDGKGMSLTEINGKPELILGNCNAEAKAFGLLKSGLKFIKAPQAAAYAMVNSNAGSKKVNLSRGQGYCSENAHGVFIGKAEKVEFFNSKGSKI